MRYFPDRRSLRYALAGSAAALAVVALLGATVSGFPSRPLFRSLTIGAGTAADPREELRINATDQLGVRVTGPRPVLKFNETQQAADNRLWYMQSDGLAFTIRAVNDAEDVATNPLLITRSGTAISSIVLSGPSTLDGGGALPLTTTATIGNTAVFSSTHASGPYVTFARSGGAFGDLGNAPQIFSGGTLDDFAIGTRATGDFVVATGGTAAERFRIDDAGASRFTGSVEFNATAPRTLYNETDAPANEKIYACVNVAGKMFCETRTDADGAGQSWLEVDRTGTTVDSINLVATAVTVNGVPIFGGSGAQGTFTASFDTACSTTPTVTYDWTRSGNLVVLYPVSTTGFPCTGDSTSFITTGAPVPAAIRPNTNADTAPHPGYTDNSVSTWAQVTVTSGGNISYNKCTALNTTCNGAGWTAANNRSAPTLTTIVFMLGNP